MNRLPRVLGGLEDRHVLSRLGDLAAPGVPPHPEDRVARWDHLLRLVPTFLGDQSVQLALLAPGDREVLLAPEDHPPHLGRYDRCIRLFQEDLGVLERSSTSGGYGISRMGMGTTPHVGRVRDSISPYYCQSFFSGKKKFLALFQEKRATIRHYRHASEVDRKHPPETPDIDARQLHP